MAMRKEIITDIEKFVIVQSIDDHDCLFAILRDEYMAMIDLKRSHREANTALPIDSPVLAFPMGKIQSMNQFTNQYDIISDKPLRVQINSIEGTFIKHGNW